MKIGIDIQSTKGAKTGIGYYTANLLNEFHNCNKQFQLIDYSLPGKNNLNTIERIKWESFTLPKLAGKDKLDILHIPGFAGPILKGKYKKVTTVHDLIGMIYPQNLAPLSRFYWQKWLPACIKKSDLIIADSENTKKDIIRLLNIPEKKIKVIYLAVSQGFKPVAKNSAAREGLKRFGIDLAPAREYILSVGTIEPRKNITGLIEAFNLYIKEKRNESLLLVIAGTKGWDYQKCCGKIKALGIEKQVLFCDYVSDDDLVTLYNFAQALVYPSFYEGFGLPVLEAMNCGLPVICSGTSSLPEVTGSAALLINPDDIDSIKNALKTLLGNKNLQKELSEKSLAQAKKFSWEKTAGETISAYEGVLY